MDVLLAWSSGKDSAWSHHLLSRDPEHAVGALLTTVDQQSQCVAMHGTPVPLVRAQAAALDLPLWEVPLPKPCPNDAYDAAMRGVVDRAVADGFEALAFGDLFLEDIRAYRESRLADTGLHTLFPLWGQPTAELARTMIDGGLRARLTAVDASRLPASFAGREFDRRLLDDLPAGIDPCGENGEFHTFVYDAPGFAAPIDVRSGSVELRDDLFTAVLTPCSP